ncbi:beta/gamma crystallin domain-containing protein [Streptomyces niveiscabiei]
MIHQTNRVGMKLSRRTRLSGLVAAAAALTALVGTAAPAQAINRVECNGRTDFLRIFNDGVVCFANAGYIDVAIYNVNQISAGNNSGDVTVWRTIGGPVQNFVFSRNESILSGDPHFHKVSSIWIR